MVISGYIAITDYCYGFGSSHLGETTTVASQSLQLLQPRFTFTIPCFILYQLNVYFVGWQSSFHTQKERERDVHSMCCVYQYQPKSSTIYWHGSITAYSIAIVVVVAVMPNTSVSYISFDIQKSQFLLFCPFVYRFVSLSSCLSILRWMFGSNWIEWAEVSTPHTKVYTKLALLPLSSSKRFVYLCRLKWIYRSICFIFVSTLIFIFTSIHSALISLHFISNKCAFTSNTNSSVFGNPTNSFECQWIKIQFEFFIVVCACEKMSKRLSLERILSESVWRARLRSSELIWYRHRQMPFRTVASKMLILIVILNGTFNCSLNAHRIMTRIFKWNWLAFVHPRATLHWPFILNDISIDTVQMCRCEMKTIASVKLLVHTKSVQYVQKLSSMKWQSWILIFLVSGFIVAMVTFALALFFVRLHTPLIGYKFSNRKLLNNIGFTSVSLASLLCMLFYAT